MLYKLMKKIAFMFLTYDNLKQPTVWENFLKGNEKKYTLYLHSKNPGRVTDPLLEDHLISNLISTQWGSISLVNATINLMEEAYKDPENYKFALVSDSCIPICTFKEVYSALTKDNKSYILGYDANKNRYEALLDKSFISKKDFKKQHQWMVLNRETVNLIVTTRYHTKIFHKMFAPDEHYFINVIIHYNYPYENKLLTYTDWRSCTDHPRVFRSVNSTMINQIKKYGFLFLRKVDYDTKLERPRKTMPVYLYVIIGLILLFVFSKN